MIKHTIKSSEDSTTQARIAIITVMKKAILFISLMVCVSTVQADYEGYDEIVEKLSKYNTKDLTSNAAYRTEMRTFSRAHLGLGLTQTFYDADAPGVSSSMQNQGGLLINLGVDVFSTSWGLEGSYSNFGTLQTSNTSMRLREFNLKALYKPTINKVWNMRMGLGFSSRFLDIANTLQNREYRTPSGVFTFGIDSYLNSFISVGADINFKTAMITDTIDKNSVDLAFRVDTHF